jgi:hypothetical protein
LKIFKKEKRRRKMRNLKKVFAITFLFILLGTTLGICQPELIPYRKGNEWGFCDRNKKIVIPIKYDGAGSFSKGLAPVTFMGEKDYIDKEGTEYFVFVGNLKEVVTNIVEEWLQVQKRGESGDIYWTKPRLAKSLYAVREWEIVNCSIEENTASVTVRISSSTKKGFPIIKLWRFTLKKQPNGDWKISNLTEAQ